MSSISGDQTGCNRVAAFFHSNRIYIIPSVIHWGITFLTDRLVFISDESSNVLNYIACKVILLPMLFLLWKAVVKAVCEHDKETLKILKFAGIYLIPMIAVMAFKLPEGYLSNDESLIFEEAVRLKDYTWFSYLTTWYYILSLMLIPFKYGPIIVKVVIQVLVCGYVVKRMTDITSFKYGIFSYIPFIFFPVLAYTTSAHRIPVYFLLYAFLLVKMLLDKAENRSISFYDIAWILILGAVLTQWRTEGIYLVLILPLLIFTAYPDLRRGKSAAVIIAGFLFLQYLVSIPQTGVIPGRMGDKANNRMGPFYAYTITNMFRNGLDRDRNSGDIEKVGRYLSIEAIDRINEDLKDINYEDVLILYYPGYVGVKEDAESRDYIAYTEGCRNIFKNNPDVFLRTRAGAFNYAALPYHIEAGAGGVKLLFSAVKAGFYNLYIPHLLLLLGWIISLIKKKWYVFFAASGLIGHFIIVFVLAPASYFKYYFPVYFTVYLYLTLFLITAVYNRNRDTKVIL